MAPDHEASRTASEIDTRAKGVTAMQLSDRIAAVRRVMERE